uniref:Zinc finger BED domain-containing protein RICESLEEPER 2 n=1 Tax=Tanacetum cinerariifolium TaxID=118510 RepID=A0A6L2K422_TANCI|nr:zinc finger BED domain-containing protein RICESLEEPER 2 [Tanacetum cinerariifolium]
MYFHVCSNTTLRNYITHPHCEVLKAQKNQNSKAGQTSMARDGSVFSGRVLSIRRTRLTPASLEMCKCLKDHLDAKQRKQDKCPLETPLDFEEDVFDDEVQRNEAIPLSDKEIALDANGSSECTMSPGGPRYDYMMSSEAEDDY